MSPFSSSYNSFFELVTKCLSFKSSLNKISSKINIKNKISTDTLFLKGEKSNYINKNDSMLDFLHFNIIEINNSGHWVHADNPKEFLKAVIGFI